jgi:hypothetical protein
MVEDDRTYYIRRAAQCRRLARQSKDSAVRVAHLTMERRYQTLIEGGALGLVNG